MVRNSCNNKSRKIRKSPKSRKRVQKGTGFYRHKLLHGGGDTQEDMLTNEINNLSDKINSILKNCDKSSSSGGSPPVYFGGNLKSYLKKNMKGY